MFYYRMELHVWMVLMIIPVSAVEILLENSVKLHQWSPCCILRLLLVSIMIVKMVFVSSQWAQMTTYANVHLDILVIYIYKIFVKKGNIYSKTSAYARDILYNKCCVTLIHVIRYMFDSSKKL